MKVLIVNSSPHRNGNTSIALEEMIKIFKNEGVETELLNIGTQSIRGCIACNSCAKNGKCVFDDAVNKAAPLLKEADGLVIASPVYYASANATLIAFLDRLFYSTSFDKTMKVGAAVVVARRGGSVSETFTVRKMSSGVGVERTFPIHSPKVAGITVIRRGKVRRAKLNFLKGMVGSYRIKERGQK